MKLDRGGSLEGGLADGLAYHIVCDDLVFHALSSFHLPKARRLLAVTRPFLTVTE